MDKEPPMNQQQYKVINPSWHKSRVTGGNAYFSVNPSTLQLKLEMVAFDSIKGYRQHRRAMDQGRN
jgi:hypothetical protein